MSSKVLVTGIGIVSAIGNNADEVLNAVLMNKTAMGFTSYIDTNLKNELPIAEIKLSHEDLLKRIPVTTLLNTYTRASLLGILAVGEALNQAHITNNNKVRTGLISSTSVGGMDKSELFFKDFINDPDKGRLKDVVGHDCGNSTDNIARFFNIKDYVTTISTACSSSANAIMLGARLIRNNILDRVIVGGVDALTKFTINGFNTLMILDRQHCRPFDATRSGLNIGEGAGYLVLESQNIVDSENKVVLCEVKGYGNACDAFHQTASSPEGIGPCLAMRKALAVAALHPDEISYINAHGTGTPNNDLSEGKAIEDVFGKNAPPFSSTKPFTGHTLGASGAIEAVLCVLAIKHNLIYPNLNYAVPMKELSIRPVTNLIKTIEVKNVLSNSFGFGGNNTTLIFSKY